MEVLAGMLEVRVAGGTGAAGAGVGGGLEGVGCVQRGLFWAVQILVYASADESGCVIPCLAQLALGRARGRWWGGLRRGWFRVGAAAVARGV